jgi:hypothetical protein
MKETSDGENNGRFSCQSKKKNSERQTNLKHSAVGRAAPQPPAPNNCIRIGFGRGIVVTARYATRSNASRSSALAPNNSKAACCSALRVNSSLTFLSSRNFATKIETCGKESERERKKKREREKTQTCTSAKLSIDFVASKALQNSDAIPLVAIR